MKRVKKYFAVLLAVIVLLSMTVVSAGAVSIDAIPAGVGEETEAQVFTSGDYQYTYAWEGEDAYISIVGYTGHDVNLKIPEMIDGKYVVFIEQGAFYGCDFLNSVKVPNTVMYVSGRAFLECNNMTQILIDRTNPFLFVRDNILYEKYEDQINLLYCPAADGRKNIVLKDDVSCIGDGAFANNITLESIVFPSNLTIIDTAAFYGCKNLKEINLPDTLELLWFLAFYNCDSLEKVHIPSAVTELQGTAFSGCDRLKEISVAEENLNYCSENGILFSKDKKELLAYPSGLHGAYQVPAYVTSIGYGAFVDCPYITELMIPESVTELQSSVISECPMLEKLILPKTMKKICSLAVTECVNLKEVYIPRAVQTIEEYALGYYFDGETGAEQKYDDFILKGYAGSPAETYAVQNGFQFVDVLNGKVLGDVNTDGKLDITDATCLQLHLAGVVFEENFDLSVADINEDGAVNILDVTEMQLMIASV